MQRLELYTAYNDYLKETVAEEASFEEEKFNSTQQLGPSLRKVFIVALVFRNSSLNFLIV